VLGLRRQRLSRTKGIVDDIAQTPGTRTFSVTETDLSAGFDTILAGGNNNNRITITNSTMNRPGNTAIGQLTITTGNGNDTFTIDTINVGPTRITSGTGNNLLTFNHSNILQADIVFGTEAAGAQGNNRVTMDTENSRASCCGSSRRANTNRSVAMKPSIAPRGSLSPATETSKRPWNAANSVAISITA